MGKRSLENEREKGIPFYVRPLAAAERVLDSAYTRFLRGSVPEEYYDPHLIISRAVCYLWGGAGAAIFVRAKDGLFSVPFSYMRILEPMLIEMVLLVTAALILGKEIKSLESTSIAPEREKEVVSVNGGLSLLQASMGSLLAILFLEGITPKGVVGWIPLLAMAFAILGISLAKRELTSYLTVNASRRDR